MKANTYKWSKPDEVLWVRMKVAAPGILASAGATGQYAYAFQNLSLRVRRMFITADHSVDPQSVLRFDNGMRAKTEVGLIVPQSKEPIVFYETLNRCDEPGKSDTSTVTTTTRQGFSETSIVHGGPAGISSCSTPL